MKNKRVLLLLLLLIIVMVLGIGYAISNKTLIISGTATATAADDNFVVRFKKTDGNYDAPTNLKNAIASVTKDNEATITVTGLTKVGDTATATYEVENASEGLDAKIKAEAVVKDNTYFKVTTTDITSTETELAQGASKKVTVTVELVKTPIEDKTTDVTVTLTAVPVEK